MKEVYLTQEGLEELKQRLDYLIVYLRGDVAKKLQHARELGDLSENAEYDAAKQEESQVAAEIKELEERIKNAVIIEKSGTHKVSIGNTITVEYLGELDEDEDKEMTFKLVGETEADLQKANSPMNLRSAKLCSAKRAAKSSDSQLPKADLKSTKSSTSNKH